MYHNCWCTYYGVVCTCDLKCCYLAKHKNIDTVILFAFVTYISSGTCPQFSLTSPPMGTYSCPGSIIIYTCVLNSSAMTVITHWSGSAFQFLCPPSNQIALLQGISGIPQQFTTVLCGSLSAVTTNVTSTCYTSVLTIPAVQALDGTTVVCWDDATRAVVGNDTLKIISELYM